MTMHSYESSLSVNFTSLGSAFAGNTVNTVPFRTFGCSFGQEYHFCAAFVSAQVLRVFKRNIDQGSIEWFDFDGCFPIEDSHNAISIGCDACGHVHLAYSEHGGGLHYRVSTEPLNIERWSEEKAMTGVQENKLTYPQFFCGPSPCRSIYFVYRFGSWKKARVGLKVFDAELKIWTDVHVALIAGDLDGPWSSCPYLNTPAFVRPDEIGLAYTWRLYDQFDPDSVLNLDICFARSSDGGVTWLTANGKRIPTPITRTVSESIVAVGRGRDLMNQCGACAASDGSFHLSLLMKDEKGVSQYWYMCYRDESWSIRPIATLPGQYVLRGGGTLRLPTSRPEIAAFPSGEVFMFYRNDSTGGRLAAHKVAEGFGKIEVSGLEIIGCEDVGDAEICLDRSAIDSHGRLSIFEQSNFYSPDGGCLDLKFSEIRLLDVTIKSNHV